MTFIRRLQRAGLAAILAAAVSGAGYGPAIAQTTPAPASGTTTTSTPTTSTTTTTTTPTTTPTTTASTPAPGSGTTPARFGAADQTQPNSAGATVATNGTQTGPTDADQTPDPGVYAKMFRTLFIVFVLAVVLESALALIFNWRPFLLHFDGRGVRSVVSFVLALLIAVALHLDVIRQLYNAWTGTNGRYDLDGVGYVLTALVIAGGSAGVNNLLRALGFRSMAAREDVRPKPPKDHAWLAVRVLRRGERAEIATPVSVFIQKDGGKEELVGMISGVRSPTGLLRMFLTDKARFPTVGGFTLDGGETYAVRVEGKDKNGAVHSTAWGRYAIAKGAIVDLELELPER
jgi:hypothetical protein